MAKLLDIILKISNIYFGCVTNGSTERESSRKKLTEIFKFSPIPLQTDRRKERLRDGRMDIPNIVVASLLI